VHPYNAPVPTILLPLGFIFASLIVYWGGWDATWRLAIAVVIGQLIFVISALLKAENVDVAKARWRSAIWMWAWLAGMVVIGLFGQYGSTELKVIPQYWDAGVVAVWALIIFYFAVSQAQSTAEIKESVATDMSDDSISGDPMTGATAVIN
jgi:small-conductance mechanosensitive channel